MTKLKSLVFFLMLISLSCVTKSEKGKTDDELTLGHFVDLADLDKVKMSNNSGTFNLSDKQLEQFEAELSQMTYDPDISVKVGAILIELVIDGKTYHMSSSTQGDYIEVHREIVTKNKSSVGSSDFLYFKTNGVNFDNYKTKNL